MSKKYDLYDVAEFLNDLNLEEIWVEGDSGIIFPEKESAWTYYKNWCVENDEEPSQTIFNENFSKMTWLEYFDMV